MTLSPLVFAALIFALVVSISYAVLVRWLPDPGKERLAQLTPGRGSDHSTLWSRLQKRLLAWLLWLSPWTAAMSGGDEETPSALRVRFGHAAWRSPVALQIYFTCKTLLTLVLPLIAWALVEISPLGIRKACNAFCPCWWAQP